MSLCYNSSNEFTFKYRVHTYAEPSNSYIKTLTEDTNGTAENRTTVDTWTFISYQFAQDTATKKLTTTLTFKHGAAAVSLTQNETGIFFYDYESAIFLGRTISSNHFKGMMYELRWADTAATIATGCSTLMGSDNVCLSSCPWDKPHSSDCTSTCLSSCSPESCNRTTDCKLYDDVECSTTTYYEKCDGTCVTLATKDATTELCSCVTNSTYSSSAGACVCDSGWNPSQQNTCVECRNYLRKQDFDGKPVINANYT
jgi:hypothetical protein